MNECSKCETCGNYPAKCFECGASADIYDHYPCYKHRDVVRVIRCKDCGYFHQPENDLMICNRPCEAPVVRFPDDFCSKAVRKQRYNKPDFTNHDGSHDYD